MWEERRSAVLEISGKDSGTLEDEELFFFGE